MEPSNTVSQATVADLVSRIGRVAQPSRIILFGSASRGQMGPNSDLDVLGVMPDGVHRRETARRICHAPRGLGIPKDVVVVTESDVERFGDEPSLVIHAALSEGRTVFHGV